MYSVVSHHSSFCCWDYLVKCSHNDNVYFGIWWTTPYTMCISYPRNQNVLFLVIRNCEWCNLATQLNNSIGPRPSPPLAFDCIQYANTEGEGLGNLIMYDEVMWCWGRHTGAGQRISSPFYVLSCPRTEVVFWYTLDWSMQSLWIIIVTHNSCVSNLQSTKITASSQILEMV